MAENAPILHIKDTVQTEPLTRQEVEGIVHSFLQHIRDNWETYSNNLPPLRRTLMYYNEFATALPKLPEYEACAGEFDSREALSAQSLVRYFGDALTYEVARLVHDARPRRMEGSESRGYKEPIAYTPESLQADMPDLFPSVEAARFHMFDCGGTDFGWVDDQRLELAGYGTPHIAFTGFTTVEEFPAQRALLDTIRNHPRIQHAIHLLEEEYRQKDSERQRERDEIIETVEAAKADRVTHDTTSSGEGLSRADATKLVLDIWKSLQDPK